MSRKRSCLDEGYSFSVFFLEFFRSDSSCNSSWGKTNPPKPRTGPDPPRNSFEFLKIRGSANLDVFVKNMTRRVKRAGAMMSL